MGHRGSSCRRALTLIELLVVISIIAILAGLALPVFSSVFKQSNQVITLSNMHQVGTAFLLYAGDNDFKLPNRATALPDGTIPDKWPRLMQSYLKNLAVYNSPIPGYVGTAYQVTDPTQVTSNSINNTDYIANGYNDLGAFTDSTIFPRLNSVSVPSAVILVGIPYPGMHQYYMDFSEGIGNNNEVLDKTAFVSGSIYVFCDGSSRFLINNSKQNMQAKPIDGQTYSDWLWLVNKDNATVIQ